jgi:predicted ATP-dependent endonuclease of OLD family
MELFQVDISGFRKFKEKTVLKTRGKVLAILGANEAGKSSLLKALTRLNDEKPFQPHEVSRGSDISNVSLKAHYLLSDDDREHANIPDARWYMITKCPTGERKWWIEPRPEDRDYRYRQKLSKDASTIASKPKMAAFLGEADENLVPETIRFCSFICQRNEDLSDSEKATFSNLAERWKSILDRDSPSYLNAFSNALDAAVKAENAESARLIAGRKLWERLPDYLIFGDEDRNLKSSYAWAEIAEQIPDALENLAMIAELDLPLLIRKMTANVIDPENDTMLDKANAALKKNFQNSWKQSSVSVVLSKSDQYLLIQVHNNQGERTDFDQRSDGLRQFVALRCFTAARESNNFVLLIDEAEQHLHYDAQADLIQMFGTQDIATKVIYTTHSVGCLPEDLGNGVRLVEPTTKGSDWSKIENKFWSHRNDNEAAFSPILMGMGASTMAFFPTRSAVLTEGPSDTILLPTMFREVLGQDSLGVQFVHGLSEDGRMQLPLLNSTGREVCYLLDDDDGGRTLRDDLVARKVKKSSVFQLHCSDGDCELEDFLASDVLTEAVNALAANHLKIAELVASEALPKIGKWDYIKRACVDASVKVLSKPDVAYAVLEILDANPTRHILDQKLRNSFKRVAEKVMLAAKNSDDMVLPS